MSLESLKVFGTPRRTQVLVALALLEDAYPSLLARLLDARLFSIQQIVEKLEDEGLIATRLVGKERQVRLDPRYFAAKELRVLLLRLAEGMPQLQCRVSELRTRPRKRGKAL